MANKYWDWEFVKGKKIVKDGKTTEVNVAGEIAFHIDADLEKKLDEARENRKKAMEEAESAKKARAAAGEITGEERKKIDDIYLTSDRKFVEEKSNVEKYEKMLYVTKNNRDVFFRVERLKDRYSRKEGLVIDIIRDGMQDGKIVTDIGSLDKDIFKLEQFGIYLTPPYYGDLSKKISNNYFELATLESEFIGNDVPEQAVKRFAQICYEQIIENEKKEKDKKDKKDNKGVEKDPKGKWYYVAPSMVEEWYEESGFRAFKLSSLKEALIIYGYAKANPGRNDLNVAKKGRVICLNVKKLEEMGVYEYDEE